MIEYILALMIGTNEIYTSFHGSKAECEEVRQQYVDLTKKVWDADANAQCKEAPKR